MLYQQESTGESNGDITKQTKNTARLYWRTASQRVAETQRQLLIDLKGLR